MILNIAEMLAMLVKVQDPDQKAGWAFCLAVADDTEHKFYYFASLDQAIACVLDNEVLGSMPDLLDDFDENEKLLDSTNFKLLDQSNNILLDGVLELHFINQSAATQFKTALQKKLTQLLKEYQLSK